jgi:DNA-directed RNA polymerase specialized sigma24 family protein
MDAGILGPLLPAEVGSLLRFARTLTSDAQQAEDLV